jgi:hypothetical protein
MQIFRDQSDGEWPISLHMGEIIRIRAESNKRFDLFDPTKDELAMTLLNDLPTCWEVLWYVCSPTAKAREITAEEFGKRLGDETLLVAQKALFEEWRDFFRRLGREELALVVEKAAKYQAKKIELVKARLNDPLLTNLDPRVEAQMTAELNRSFGNLEASLAKTLGPTPSGSSA